MPLLGCCLASGCSVFLLFREGNGHQIRYLLLFLTFGVAYGHRVRYWATKGRSMLEIGQLAERMSDKFVVDVNCYK